MIGIEKRNLIIQDLTEKKLSQTEIATKHNVSIYTVCKFSCHASQRTYCASFRMTIFLNVV